MKNNIKNKLMIIVLASMMPLGSATASLLPLERVLEEEGMVVAEQEAAARSVEGAPQVEAASASRGSANLAGAMNARAGVVPAEIPSAAAALRNELEPGAQPVNVADQQAPKEAVKPAENASGPQAEKAVAGEPAAKEAAKPDDKWYIKGIKTAGVAAGAAAAGAAGDVIANLLEDKKKASRDQATFDAKLAADQVIIAQMTQAVTDKIASDKALQAAALAQAAEDAQALADKASAQATVAQSSAEKAKKTASDLASEIANAKTGVQHAQAFVKVAKAKLNADNGKVAAINKARASVVRNKALAAAKHAVTLASNVVAQAGALLKAYQAIDKAKNAHASKATLDTLAAAAMKAEETYKKALVQK